jgi:hypothetical protein
MTQVDVRWQVEADTPRLNCTPLRGHVETWEIFSRFCLDEWQGKAVQNFYVLATCFPAGGTTPAKLLERYARGCDLVETYEKREPYRFAPQLYWRAKNKASAGAVQIELISSIQTELLDSDPESHIISIANRAELFHADELSADAFTPLRVQKEPLVIRSESPSQNLFVLRDTTSGLSYAEMVHPTDFVRVEIRNDGQVWSLGSDLFSDRLEKGVIRRGRICGWFMAAENDLETAVQLAREFVEEPLPLTA